MTVHKNIRVFGKVQGVNFRHDTKLTADRLNVKGFVTNEPEGNVYIEAEGGEEDLALFLDWARTGPEDSEISEVEVEDGKVVSYSDFEIE